MSLLPRERVLASAGSGKTYALSLRAAAILLAGVDPGSLLGSTFTRAAALEIRERILRWLVRGARGEAEALEELSETLGRPVVREEVLTTLERTVAALPRLQVRTLDGFFASIASAFARDLGLPEEHRTIEDDEDRALWVEAVGLALESGDDDGLAAMSALLTRFHGGLRARRVHDSVADAVVRFHEAAIDTIPGAWTWLEPSPPPLDDAAVEARLAAIEALLESGAVTGRLATTLASDLERARTGEWKAWFDSGLPKKLLAGETTFGKVEIPDAVIDVLAPVLAHAGATCVAEAHHGLLATRDLLHAVAAARETLKQRRRLVGYDDLARTVAAAEGSIAGDLIAWRLDGRIDHVLLDEFQDTSLAQWRALRPILAEIAGDESRDRSVFCVGDVKQAIYGWRGGSSALLERFGELLLGEGGGDFEPRCLNKSYRSGPAIIEAINAVFRDLEGTPALRGEAAFVAAARHWDAQWKDHVSARPRIRAQVAIHLTDVRGTVEPRRAARAARACALVREIHAAEPEATIGVLVRTRKMGSRILHDLVHGADPVDVVFRGGGTLLSSPAVTPCLALLRLADHPGDTVAAFHVASSPLGSRLADVPGLGGAFEAWDDPVARRRLALRVRGMLMRDGGAAFLDALAVALAPDCDPPQRARLERLVGLGAQWDARRSVETSRRPTDLVRLVSHVRVPDDRAAPVQVMTVHASKGLEFDHVVLADLDDLLARVQRSVIVDRAEATGPIVGVAPWPHAVVRAHHAPVAAAAERTHQTMVQDALCALYVAMTRPRRGLVLVLDPPPEEGDEARTAGGLVRGQLGIVEPADGNAPVWTRDDGQPESPPLDEDEPTGTPGTASSPPHDPPTALPPITLAPPKRPLAARASASRTAESTATLAERLRILDPEARERGTAVHRLFEEVTWLEDLDADPARLAALVRASVPTRDADWATRQVAAFRAAIDRPAVAAALGRASRPDADRTEVANERPFARLDDAGALQQGFIDRLEVVRDDDGRAVRARIVDFKTDRLLPPDAPPGAGPDPASRMSHYEPQLAVYREVVRRWLGGGDPEAAPPVETVLLFTEHGLAETVHPG